MSVILSCTDGSIYASSVYAHTAWAATRLASPVHVLHMLEQSERPEKKDFSGTIGFNAESELLDELVKLEETKGRVTLKRARAILDDARAQLAQLGVADVEIEQRHGALVDAIEAFEGRSQLIVLGKRGENANFAKLHLGTNVERVVRTSAHPVLIASRAFQPIRKFLIAFDGGRSAQKAVDFACQSPLLKNLEAFIVCAALPGGQTEKELVRARERMQEAGYQVTAELVAGDAESVIAVASDRYQIDLLVMGAYGHSRIRQFMVGSTTTSMIRTVQKPLLMFR